MSNPLSLFVGDPERITEELREFTAGDSEEMPYENRLSEDHQTDYWAIDLADLLDAQSARLSVQELAGREADRSQDDELGINLALSAEQIEERFGSMLGATGRDIARRLHAQNDFWVDEVDLGRFLQEWLDALALAVKDGSGIVWVVWV
jgi:hypothetical protein